MSQSNHPRELRNDEDIISQFPLSMVPIAIEYKVIPRAKIGIKFLSFLSLRCPQYTTCNVYDCSRNMLNLLYVPETSGLEI